MENSKKRLLELNARVEDPTLWDNAAEAQKLMRERNEPIPSEVGAPCRIRS